MSSSNTNQLSNLPPFTRIITTTGEDGKATFHSTQPDPWALPNPQVAFNLLYTTSSDPVNLNDGADLKAHEAQAATGTFGHHIPHGSIARLVDTAPGNKMPPFMHRTKSLDYGVLVAGQLELHLDSGEMRLLKVGDVMVQRGTMHAWRNPSETEWARMFFVQVDTEPLVVGGRELGESFEGLSAEQMAAMMRGRSK